MEVSSIDGLSHSRGFPIEMCSGYNVARCRTRGHYWPVTIRQCKHKKGGRQVRESKARARRGGGEDLGRRKCGESGQRPRTRQSCRSAASEHKDMT